MTQHLNSFDLLRFLAASAVLISHHYSLSGLRPDRVPVFNDTLGGLAVCVFFLISGFLIYQSLQRSTDWAAFFAARLARIYPNLAFSLIFTSVLTLVFFQNYDQVDKHIDYVLSNLRMFVRGVQFTIPGVLDGRPVPGPNGSLWTLPYEFWMYVLLFVIFFLRKELRLIALYAALLFGNYLWVTAESGEYIRISTLAFRTVFWGKLASYFFTGAVLAALWHYVVSARIVAVIVGVSLCVGSWWILSSHHLPFVVGFGLLLLLVGEKGWFSTFGRFGDASYGIYVFAFPVQQIAILTVEGFYQSMAAALFVTIALGYGTWHGFEKHCIARRGYLASLLRYPFQRERLA